MSAWQIQQITAEQTRILRQRILRPHQTPEQCHYECDDHPQTFHLGAFADGELIAISSFLYQPQEKLPEPDSQYRIRGMATLLDYRGQGIGRALLDAGLERIAKRSAKLIWCNARESAFGFYEKAGFETLGELFDLPGIGPHKIMWRQVGK